MKFSRLTFSKDWNSKADFPTIETEESKVRADLQFLHNEARDAISDLVDELESAEAAAGLGATDADEKPSTVQTLLTSLLTRFKNIKKVEEGDLSADSEALPTSKVVKTYVDALDTNRDNKLKASTAAASLGATDPTNGNAKSNVQTLLSRLLNLFTGISSVTTILGNTNTTIPTSKAVSDAINSAGALPAGGSTNTVLVKTSASNYAAEWKHVKDIVTYSDLGAAASKHTHSPEDAGAVSLKGDTMTGNLHIAKANDFSYGGTTTVVGDNGNVTKRDSFYTLDKDGVVAISTRAEGDAENRVATWLAPETWADKENFLARLFRINVRKGDKDGDTYNVFHTGNIGKHYAWRTRPHEWRRQRPVAQDVGLMNYETKTFYYTDTLSIDSAEGTVKPGAITAVEAVVTAGDTTSARNALKVLMGKFWSTDESALRTATPENPVWYSPMYKYNNPDKPNNPGWFGETLQMYAETVTFSQILDPYNGVVYADDVGAYPENGTRNGIRYELIGSLDDIVAKPSEEIVTYTGTGTEHSEIDPSSITFATPPELIEYLGYTTADGVFTPYQSYSLLSNNLRYVSPYASVRLIGTEFPNKASNDSSTIFSGSMMKKSEDGRTISWYGYSTSTFAFNGSGCTYYFRGLNKGGMF